MPREAKAAIKKSVAVDERTYQFVMEYAGRKGIDYTAAVNLLLSLAKEQIELADRVSAAREQALIDAERAAASLGKAESAG